MATKYGVFVDDEQQEEFDSAAEAIRYAKKCAKLTGTKQSVYSMYLIYEVE